MGAADSTALEPHTDPNDEVCVTGTPDSALASDSELRLTAPLKSNQAPIAELYVVDIF